MKITRLDADKRLAMFQLKIARIFSDQPITELNLLSGCVSLFLHVISNWFRAQNVLLSPGFEKLKRLHRHTLDKLASLEKPTTLKRF